MTDGGFANVEGAGGGGRYARSGVFVLGEEPFEAGDEGRRKGESFTEFLLGSTIGSGAVGLPGDDRECVVSCSDKRNDDFLLISKVSFLEYFSGESVVKVGVLSNLSAGVPRRLSGVDEREYLSEDGEAAKSCFGNAETRVVPCKDIARTRLGLSSVEEKNVSERSGLAVVLDSFMIESKSTERLTRELEPLSPLNTSGVSLDSALALNF